MSDDNLETFGVIWLDVNHSNDQKTRKMEHQLRKTVNHLRKFTDIHRCEEHIRQTLEVNQLILIVISELGQQIVPSIHELPQISSIYVHSADQCNNNEWTKKFTKVIIQ